MGVRSISGSIIRAVPETRPFSAILESRSAGIVDLRHGYISNDEWEGQDLTAQWGLDRIAAAPLPRARYYFVASTLGGRPHDRLTADAGT